MQRLRFALAAATAVALLLVSCGGGGSSPGDPPVEFAVSQTSPPADAFDVAQRADIRIFFSRPVDAATLTDESLRVVAPGNREIRGQRSVSRLSPTTVTFRPLESYLEGTIHTVFVTTAVRDTSGKPLVTAHESQFTTVVPPNLPSPIILGNLGDALTGGRWFHRATLMSDNRILVAGGYGAGSTLQTLVEVFDPLTRQATVQQDRLAQARAQHVQINMSNGDVLIAGGETNDSPFTPIASAELFDASTRKMRAAAPMNFARSAATAVELPNGSILVIGGQSLDAGGQFIFRDDAEIYHPGSNTWTLVNGVMDRGRSGHGAWSLPNGRVLVVGGTSAGPSAQILDIALSEFLVPTTLPTRAHIFGAFTRLADGRAIYFGGSGTREFTIFDEQFGFLAGINAMVDERVFATAHGLSDGRVVLIGGTDFTRNPALLQTTIDVMIPEGATGTIFRVPNFILPKPTSHHASVLDSRGDVWIFGGLPTDFSQGGRRQVTAIFFSAE